tara:strand:+ start:3517 stop:6852 length:3336 start_codon:yes stop_codon:yes gene_type:complete
MPDISSKFEQMSGGLKTKDFADSIAKHSGDWASTMQTYTNVINTQIEAHKKDLARTKNQQKNANATLNIMTKMLPWRNKEYKYLKNLNKEQTKSIRNLKLHNTAMGSALSGLKRGGAAAGAGIGKLAGKLGMLGIGLKVLKTIADQFLRVNKFTADVAKQFGISTKAAQGYVSVLQGAEKDTAGFLLNMEQLNEVAGELALQMGGLNKITSEAVVVSAKLQKAFGLTAKQSADLFTTMSINMGMTAQEVEAANASMQSFAEKNGALASLVMRDLASSAALTAMSMGKTMEEVGAASIQAQKLGTTFEALKEGGKRFILDFEGSSESIAKINNMLGTSMRADMMAINAETGNWLDNQHMILDAVEAYEASGKRSTIIESELEQFGGQKMDDLLRMTKLRKSGNLDLVKERNERKKLDDLLKSGMDIWERIKGIVMKAIQPVLTSIGVLLNDDIVDGMSTIEASMKKWGEGMGVAFDKAEGIGGKIKALIVYITQPFADMFAEALQYAWDNLKIFDDGAKSTPERTAAQEAVSHSRSGGIVRRAMGGVHSSPTVAMIGEEGRSEIVVPTERIRKGLPVAASVANELSSIGVPGYAIGTVTGRDNRSEAFVKAQVSKRTQSNAMYASASDPAVIRKRTKDFETAANASREELRRMHRKEHNQQMTVLEAEEANTRGLTTTLNGLSGRGPASVGGGGSGSSIGSIGDRMFKGGMESLKNLAKDVLAGTLKTNIKWLDDAAKIHQTYQQAKGLYTGGKAAYKKGGMSGLARFGLGTKGGKDLVGNMNKFNEGFAKRTSGAMDRLEKMDPRVGKKYMKDTYVKEMGGASGMAKGAAMGGLSDAAGVLMAGGSLKDAAVSGLSSAAAQGVGMAATAGLIGMGVPPALANLVGSAAGKIVVGGAMKMLGKGASKSKKRKAAMKNFKAAVKGNRTLSTFSASNTLMKSIINADGSVNEGSKQKTMQEMASILDAAGVKSQPKDVEALMWALIGMNNAEVASQLPQSPMETIAAFQAEIDEGAGDGRASAAKPGARSAAGVNGRNSFATSVASGGGMRANGSFGGGGGGGEGSVEDQRLMLHELRQISNSLNNRTTDVRVDMDGREVARLVSENQEELALG